MAHESSRTLSSAEAPWPSVAVRGPAHLRECVGAPDCYTGGMTTEELTKGIQFVVDGQGKVTSVVLTPEAWRQIIARLEDDEDRALLAQLAPKLAAGPGAALRWSDVEREWA